MVKIFNKLKKFFFRKNKDILLKEDVEVEVGINDLVLCDRETRNKVRILCFNKTNN